MFPEPDAVHVPPPAPTHVHVAVNEAGNVSATVDPGALLGPALDAVIVYVTDPPAVTVVTPSVLVIARSACELRVSVSVALLLAGFGSVTAPPLTVAVFDSVPVADAEIAADAVYVTDAPAGRFAVSLMFPEPDAVHVPPPAPTHVHVAVNEAGKVSAMVAVGTGSGPAFDAVIVYVTEPPAVAVVTPSVLVIARSAGSVGSWAGTAAIVDPAPAATSTSSAPARPARRNPQLVIEAPSHHIEREHVTLHRLGRRRRPSGP